MIDVDTDCWSVPALSNLEVWDSSAMTTVDYTDKEVVNVDNCRQGCTTISTDDNRWMDGLGNFDPVHPVIRLQPIPGSESTSVYCPLLYASNNIYNDRRQGCMIHPAYLACHVQRAGTAKVGCTARTSIRLSVITDWQAGF